MATWERKLLEELIYERVRLNVDLFELVEFERDLSESIERALASCGDKAEVRERIAREHIERAWKRVETEWRAEREGSAEPMQCPMCGDLADPGGDEDGGADPRRPLHPPPIPILKPYG